MTRTITVHIDDPTMKEVAAIFARADATGQAKFFNEIANYVEKEYHGSFDFQMNAMQKYNLTPEARVIMKTIGDYS